MFRCIRFSPVEKKLCLEYFFSRLSYTCLRTLHPHNPIQIWEMRLRYCNAENVSIGRSIQSNWKRHNWKLYYFNTENEFVFSSFLKQRPAVYSQR